MAHKKAKRRKRHHSSVAAPRKRRKRVGASAPVIGSPRRRRSKKMGARKHRRKRMGASVTMSKPGAGEFIFTTLGIGMGLTVAEMLTNPMYNVMGPVVTAGTKLGAGIGAYALGAYGLNNNGFVKGLGYGFTGSAANDGIRALRGGGYMSGPGDTIITIKDEGRQLNPGNKHLAVPMAKSAPVIGDYTHYQEMPLNY